MDNQPYDKLYCVGDYLLIQLSSEDIYEGEYYHGSEDRIDLINATKHNNPNKLGGIYSFYRGEIFQINLFKSKLGESQIREDPDDKKIKVTRDEYIRLREMSTSNIYLGHVDDRYYAAIDDLNKAESIGIAAVGLEARQTGTLKILVISTWQKVYIFDLINLRNNYFYPELKEILESPYICKVIHNSGRIIEVLSKKYNVFTENIFDAYFVDLVIEKNKSATCNNAALKGKDLSDSLVAYLHLPMSLLQDASKITLTKWMERPLTGNQRIFAAQFATYLIVLKDAMQKILFGEVYGAIDKHLKYYSSLSSTEQCCLHKPSTQINEDIDKLIPYFVRQE